MAAVEISPHRWRRHHCHRCYEADQHKPACVIEATLASEKVERTISPGFARATKSNPDRRAAAARPRTRRRHGMARRSMMARARLRTVAIQSP